MVQIGLTIATETPLHFGSGTSQGTLAQRTMLKDPEGWPYIPASAIKGRLRHAMEQILSTIASAGPILDPHENRIRKPTDTVSILFGTPWQAGTVMFEDLQLVGPQYVIDYKERRKHAQTSERVSVSMNRRRRVAADQRLFRTEVFWPGIPMQFGGQISGELDKAQAGLIVAGLRSITSLGGSKTSGLGWVSIENEVRAGNVVWSNSELLAAVKEEL